MHPAAWWCWAIGVAVAATQAGSTYLVAAVAAAAILTASILRDPGGSAFGGYLILAAAILVMRLMFHVLVGIKTPGTVVLDLPSVPLPDWAAGVALLGPVTIEGIASAADGGFRLATLVVCLGAAASLAGPMRLLRTLPAALHRAASAVAIAIGVAPALSAAVGSARRARRLRGLPVRGWSATRSIAVPVLTEAMDRSLALAASMDVRGYARVAAKRDGRVGPLLLVALLGFAVGTYALLAPADPPWLWAPAFAVGILAAVAGSALAGRRLQRTRYRPEPWRASETIVTACGAMAAIGTAIGPASLTMAVVALAAFTPLGLAVSRRVVTV